MNLQEANKYLDSLKNSENLLGNPEQIDFSLDNIKQLLSKFGNPQNDLKIIHIAGSKGKGSTCAFIANILKCAGYKVGLYTSPHLYSRRERIRLLSKESDVHLEGLFGDEITGQELCAILDIVKAFADEIPGLTFFEVFTALAILFFKHEKADVVVLETGLGGRLDATNIVNADVCVITPISLEHTSLLGNSLEEIAEEKVAIIKQGIKAVISSEQEQEAMNVLIKRCAECDVLPEILHEDFVQVEQNSLAGQHQDDNASVAVAAVGALEGMGFNIGKEDIIEGLNSVVWPGRFEIVKQNPYVVLDCAHNGASAKVLKETFVQEFLGKKAVLVFGASCDKNIENISEELDEICQKVIFTKSKNSRAFDVGKFKEKNIFTEKEKVFTENIQQALDAAISSTQTENVILVTGSLFLVAEARNTLLGE